MLLLHRLLPELSTMIMAFMYAVACSKPSNDKGQDLSLLEGTG